jgi:hypothetical protein
MTRAQPVVDIMVRIGNVVGDSGGLRLGAGVEVERERRFEAPLPDRLAQDRLGRRRWSRNRPVVLHQSFQALERQIEPVERGILALEARHHVKALGVVIEAAVAGEALIEGALAGVSKGRMAEIVRQRQGLREVVVEAELARDGACDLGDLERMRQPRPVVIALVEQEHLRLVG